MSWHAWRDNPDPITLHDLWEFKMTVQSDFDDAVATIQAQITALTAAITALTAAQAQFITDVTALVTAQGNSQLTADVQAQTAVLQAAAAAATLATTQAAGDTTALGAADPVPATMTLTYPKASMAAVGAAAQIPTVTISNFSGTVLTPAAPFALNFVSGSPTTATVDQTSGKLTSVAAGQTTITVNLVAYPTVTATFLLTVTAGSTTSAPPPPSTSNPTVTPGSANVGNATISGISVVAGAPDETITLLFADASNYSVSGTTSGPLGAGVLGTPFASSVISFTVVAGTTPPSAGDTYTVTD
jgi:hypothetical protein